MAHDTLKINRPNVRMVAHRGCSGLEKENTNAAFVAAGNRSYYGVETDVHLTADGQFIIIHDDDTFRVSGDKLSVEGSTFETLRKVRLKDVDGERGRTDLCLPSLPEYIRICKKYQKVCVLELKNPIPADAIERMVDMIRAEDYLDQVVFISFHLENCVCLRHILPEQKIQFLTGYFPDWLVDTLKRYHLDLDIYFGALTKEAVDAVHKEGIEINVWTVDKLEDAQRLDDWGVDYITSNIVE